MVVVVVVVVVDGIVVVVVVDGVVDDAKVVLVVVLEAIGVEVSTLDSTVDDGDDSEEAVASEVEDKIGSTEAGVVSGIAEVEDVTVVVELVVVDRSVVDVEVVCG